MNMFKHILLVVTGLIAVSGGAVLVFAQGKASSKKQDQQSIRYEAEEGIPKDKAAEKRRDYAVLEATLNDLASPKNPEYKYAIRDGGFVGREIVVDETTIQYCSIEVTCETENIDREDARSIPIDIQKDIIRRQKEPARSLMDFKPANPHVIVCDVDKLLEGVTGIAVFDKLRKEYPAAWAYVRVNMPGYSKDGKSAVVLVEGGPNGGHGASWVYMLTKKGKPWEVQWRHFVATE
jgi:hypothetical protein